MKLFSKQKAAPPRVQLRSAGRIYISNIAIRRIGCNNAVRLTENDSGGYRHCLFHVCIRDYGFIEVRTRIQFSNVISWLTAVLFAFVTNRIWVFPTKTKGFAAFIFQMAKFYGGRLFTLGVEELMLFVFVTKLQINAVLIKLIAQVVVVILNFVISKLFVFKKNKNS